MKHLYLIKTISLISFSCLLSVNAHAKFKCWTNSEGVKECGQSVPPEYAQQGHTEVNSLGVTVNKKKRAKTEEEIAEEKRLAEEKRRADEEKAKKQHDDRILLETFSTVDDIYMTRDEKIAALESQVGLSNRRIEKIKADLDIRIARAAAQERKGKQPSKELVNDIESLKRQIKNNEEFIVEKHNEQQKIREEYADYILRFEELKK